MRYWYLKGGDVLGPLSAEEIAKDSDFSSEVLVCPEPNSGDETFWKIPAMYGEDFGPFIKTETPADVPLPAAPKASVSQEIKAPAAVTTHKEVTPAEPVIPLPAVSHAHTAKPTEAETYAALAAVSPEETIHTQSPLNAALEDNLLEDLPAKAVLAKEEEKEETKEQPKEEKKEEPKEEVKKTEEKPHPADPLIAAIESQKPLQSFREEDFTLVSPAKVAAKPVSKPAAAPAKQDEKENTLFKQKQEHAAPVIIPAASKPLPKAKAPVAKQELPVVKQEPPVAHAKVAPAPLPVETFSSGSAVVHIKQDGEEVPSHEQPQEKTPSKEKSFFSSMAAEKPINHSADEAEAPFPFGGEIKTAEVSDLIKDEPASLFVQVDKQKRQAVSKEEKEETPIIPSYSVDRVAGGIMPTTNGKIISSSDGRLEDKKPKNDVIYLLVISMVLFTGIALFMTFFGDKKDQNKSAVPAKIAQNKTEEQPSKPVLQGIEEGVASPEAEENAVPVSPVQTPDIGHEKGAIVQQDNEANKIKAQDIVKRYLLDETRGTIAEFLNGTYGGGAYQTAWSSSPLYADTYVVDFTASKVRAEPIVYLFRVDVKNGRVTGGLNGITMDLLADK